MTAARNVLKLVAKSKWKSDSTQAEEEEAPRKYYVVPSILSSICPPTHPPIHFLFIHTSIYFPHLPIHHPFPPTHLCTSTHPSVLPFIYSSVHLPTHSPTHPLISHSPTHPSIHLLPYPHTVGLLIHLLSLSNTLAVHLSTPPPSYLAFHGPMYPSIHMLFHPSLHRLSILQSIHSSILLSQPPTHLSSYPLFVN